MIAAVAVFTAVCLMSHDAVAAVHCCCFLSKIIAVGVVAVVIAVVAVDNVITADVVYIAVAAFAVIAVYGKYRYCCY